MLKVSNVAGEIYIYDAIGQDWLGGGITSKQVISALEGMGGKPVTVRINSPGGVADEGIAIYNALKRYSGGVNTVVDALAASAASVIALAGESRQTAPGARWMIHRAMTVAMGNADDMAKAQNVLNKYDESLVEIYSQYMPADTNILDLLSAETWYTADEAISAGLSTGKAAPSEAEPMVASWFKNVPNALLCKPTIELKPKIQSRKTIEKFYSR
jgi:ATP-dependent protease ClpP protease subunit